MAERISAANVLIGYSDRELVQGINRTNRKMASLDNKFKQTGAILGRAIPAAVVIAFGRQAIQKIAGFEFQMSKVAAISRASAEDMKALTKNALDVGAKSKFTAAEVGKLQEELARLGFVSNDILKLTDSVSALAIVGDNELGPTAALVANQINAFQLEAKDADRVTNVLAETIATTGLDLETLGVAMGNVAAAAKAAGFDIEETSAMLGLLKSSGIDASKAGTDLRRILIELKSQGITLGEAFEKIRGSVDPLSTATELFGDRAAASAIILSDQEQKLQSLVGTYKDSNREMENMRNIMEDNLLTDFKKLESAFDGLIQKGGVLNPLFRSITQGMTNYISSLNTGNIDISTDKLFGDDLTDKLKTLRALEAHYERTGKDAERLLEIQKEINKALARIGDVPAPGGTDIFRSTADQLFGGSEILNKGGSPNRQRPELSNLGVGADGFIGVSGTNSGGSAPEGDIASVFDLIAQNAEKAEEATKKFFGTTNEGLIESMVNATAFDNSIANMGAELEFMAANAEVTIENLGKAIKEVVLGNIRAFIAEGVAAAVRSALIGVGFPFNIIAAGAAAASATALFNSVIPSFDVGTNNVPHDMLAQVHKGEAIVPAKFNPANFSGGTGGGSGLIAETKIRGNDLLILLKRQSRTNQNLGGLTTI